MKTMPSLRFKVSAQKSDGWPKECAAASFYIVFPAYSDVQPINSVLCALAVKSSMYL